VEGLAVSVAFGHFRQFYRGKRIFLTGHTGFKGSWLSLWLNRLGAEVHGYALDPPTEPSLFQCASVSEAVTSDTRGDVADFDRLRSALTESQPDLVFHLAAQPLVRLSYADPLGTLSTNVIGTANLLEAARRAATVRAIVVITSDKVYQSGETQHFSSENDPLGGHDPYSASKAAAEIVTASYRASFFTGSDGHAARVATARAGNVIGGGDWAVDRLLPDCISAFLEGRTVRLRYPRAIRPWQHVLEPIAGYLTLGIRLCAPDGDLFATAWNFGPDIEAHATVAELAAAAARLWGNGARVDFDSSSRAAHETSRLRLDSSRARSELGWRPRWPLDQSLERTIEWYRAWKHGFDMAAFCAAQIQTYEEQDACRPDSISLALPSPV
jgi:CDP-glucose 4,6-dehydratase